MEIIAIMFLFIVPLIMFAIGASQLAKAAQTFKEAREQWRRR